MFALRSRPERLSVQFWKNRAATPIRPGWRIAVSTDDASRALAVGQMPRSRSPAPLLRSIEAEFGAGSQSAPIWTRPEQK